MTLAAELQKFKNGFLSSAPEQITGPITKSTDDFIAIYKPHTSIQIGQKFPEFHLIDVHGSEVTNSDLKGTTLISFYRGEWCPYCNLELVALQKRLPEFKARGVSLVAVSPQLPDSSLSTLEKNKLEYLVLSDIENKLAKALGILYPQPETMRKVFAAIGTDLKASNGDDSLVVPVPATFLVDVNGIVRKSFIDADYTKRLEPDTALAWIDELHGSKT